MYIGYNLGGLLLSAVWSCLLATLVAVGSTAPRMKASEARLPACFRPDSGRAALVPAMNLQFRRCRRRLGLVRTRSLSVQCGQCRLRGRTFWQRR